MKVSLSLLVLNIIDDQLRVLIQKRRNTNEPDWIDTWEVPQGKITEGKSIFSIAHKELRDEAGLELQTLLLSEKCEGLFNLSGITTYIEPFMVVNLSSPYNHQSVHVLSVAKGTAHDTLEAVDHRWVTLSELSHILISELVCPLNRNALEKLSQTAEKRLTCIVKKNKSKFCSIKNNLQVVAFDIGGVLIRWNDKFLFNTLSEMFGCSFEKIDTLISGNLRHKLHLGEISHLNLWNILCNNLSLQPSYDEFLATWRSNVQPINKNIEIVNRFKEKYPKLCIIATTNIHAVTESVLFDYHDWSTIFNHWFSSWRLGISKPQKKFFEIVTDSFQISTSHIFFIDDHEKNISSASNFGWKTFQHNFNSIIDEKRLNKEVLEWLSKI